MLHLIGQAVRHDRFGKGVVIDTTPSALTVCFADRDRKFKFPDAIGNTLTLRNGALQKNIMERFSNRS